MRGGGQGGWELRSEACVKIVKILKKDILGRGVGRVGGGGGGGQGGCVWRSEAFVKIQKKFFFFFGGGVRVGRGRGRGHRVGGSGWMGTEKSFCKNSKKDILGRGGSGQGGGRVEGGGVRVDGNGEVKLVWKFYKKIFWVGGGGSGQGGWSGWGGGGSGWMETEK